MKTALILLNCLLLVILVVVVVSDRQIDVEGHFGSHRAFKMLTTNYSELDSCHYPVKGGCLTASGTIAGEQTAACPRHWKLRTKILVDGKEYVCEDRYSADLSDRIDLWAGYGKEAHEKALEFGIQEHEIIVLR